MFPCETLKLRKWLRRSIAPTDEFVGALIPYLASAAMIDVTEKSRSERSQAVRDGTGADRDESGGFFMPAFTGRTWYVTVLSVLCVSFNASCTAPRSSEPHFAVGRAPGGVLVEDLNNDGKLDLVVANEKGRDVSVLLNDGKGGFSPSRGSPFPAGPNPNDLASGDFNGDGVVDLAIANHETQHMAFCDGVIAFADRLVQGVKLCFWFSTVAPVCRREG